MREREKSGSFPVSQRSNTAACGLTSLPVGWLSRDLFMLMSDGNWLLHITGNLLGLQGYARNLTGGNHRVTAFPMECAGSIKRIFSGRKLPHQKGRDRTKCRQGSIPEIVTRHILRETSHPRKQFALPIVDIHFRTRQTKPRMCQFLSTEFGEKLDESWSSC